MEMVEMKIGMITAENPHPINSLDGNFNHPLNIKYSDISL